jgi:hypothetical protein
MPTAKLADTRATQRRAGESAACIRLGERPELNCKGTAQIPRVTAVGDLRNGDDDPVVLYGVAAVVGEGQW